MDRYENHGQYHLSAKLVEMIHRDFQGFHPGYRDVHASGRYYAGVFKATPEARKLSRAVHLQGDSVPVTVRYSNSRSGNPWGPATTASMAVRFYLPDGTELEAHSGRGGGLDDPRYVHEHMRGATPPNVYELALREKTFHGVQALRLKPDDEKVKAQLRQAGVEQ